VKRNSPIVVCLKDSIRAAARSRCSRASVVVIPEVRSSGKGSSGTNVVRENTASQPPINTSGNGGRLRRPGTNGGPGIGTTGSDCKKRSKIFSAFLLAVEREHVKERRAEAPRNLLESKMNECSVKDGGRSVVPLNNNTTQERQEGAGGDARRFSSSHDIILKLCDNVEVIRNDLTGDNKGDVDSDVDAETSVTDPSATPSSGSGSDSETAEATVVDLSEEELARMSSCLAGCPAILCDDRTSSHPPVPPLPHDCPQCLETYYAYTHYYAQGSRYFSIEVINGGML